MSFIKILVQRYKRSRWILAKVSTIQFLFVTVQLFLKRIQVMAPQQSCDFYASMYEKLLINFVSVLLFSNWGKLNIPERSTGKWKAVWHCSLFTPSSGSSSQGFHLISSTLWSFLTWYSKENCIGQTFWLAVTGEFIILHDCKHFPDAMGVIYIHSQIP